MSIVQFVGAQSLISKSVLIVNPSAFPEMEIALYTGDIPQPGYLLCKTEYRFIVQPVHPGTSTGYYEFDWYFEDNSGNLISSRHISTCGIQVGTFIASAPDVGTYKLIVQLRDNQGNTMVVERRINFGF